MCIYLFIVFGSLIFCFSTFMINFLRLRYIKSHQVLQMTTSYRDLEKKFDMLTSLVSNQSQIITQLEKQCKAQQVQAELQTSNKPTG